MLLRDAVIVAGSAPAGYFGRNLSLQAQVSGPTLAKGRDMERPREDIHGC